MNIFTILNILELIDQGKNQQTFNAMKNTINMGLSSTNKLNLVKILTRHATNYTIANRKNRVLVKQLSNNILKERLLI